MSTPGKSQARRSRSQGARLGARRGGAPAAGGAWRAADAGHGQLAEIQRSRLLAATLRAVSELGYAEATVAQITRRARISRRTFYQLFANREECLAAALEEVVGSIERDLRAVDIAGLPWRARVRMGLWQILCFLDREPLLARVCVVQLACAGTEMLRRREAVLARLVAVVDEGRRESARESELTVLTAEGVVGAAFAIVQGRLLQAQEREIALSDLLGELMGMIVLPYLGAAAARRELQHPAPGPPAVREPQRIASGSVEDPLGGVAMRLTYRTARVLQGLGECPAASNRQVADAAGIADQGQVSKLLGRLQRLGLVSNQAPGHSKGEPNAWTLTSKGLLVAQSIHLPAPSTPKAA